METSVPPADAILPNPQRAKTRVMGWLIALLWAVWLAGMVVYWRADGQIRVFDRAQWLPPADADRRIQLRARQSAWEIPLWILPVLGVSLPVGYFILRAE